MMKKFCGLLIVCSLLLVCLAGCGLAAVSGRQNGNSGKVEEQVKPKETLWGKKLSYEIAELPAEAFQNGAERCCGMAPDGVTFLIGDGTAPYLYNIDSGKTTALMPASDSTREVIRELVMMSPGTPLQTAENAAKMSDEELLTAVFSLTQKGRVTSPKSVFPMLQTDGNYLLTADFATLGYVLINCSTGEFFCSGDDYLGNGIPVSIMDGRLLLASQPPLAAATFVDLAECRANEVDFTSAGGFESGSAMMKAAALMEDGSLCVSLRDMAQDLKNGDDCAIVIRDTDGKDAVYPIGKLKFGMEPDCLIPVGSDYVVAFSRQYMQVMPAVLIDRKSGTVSALYQASSELLKQVPSDEWTFKEGGSIQIPDNCSTIIPLELLSDGQTVLMQSVGDGMMLFFRPEGGAADMPLGEDGSLPMLPMPFYCSNHYDTFFIPNISGFTSFIRLKSR